ncbi:MAG TPA: VWA domain-containing protein [Bryobacteraceae bacterium]
MSFLNLSLGELLGLVGAISAGVVALYLLDRSKRRQVVPTLRFWIDADVRTELKHRRRVQQPLSLLLELLSLFLLVCAIAGPQLGVIDGAGRNHVVILDTSAWMGARLGRGILLDEAKESALAYLKSVPHRDRVMLIRADALATPATAFQSNRAAVEQAIRESQPGASALNLEQAFEYAQRAMKLQPERAGEIVFAGAGRVTEEQASLANVPANVRLLASNSNQENVGLRKVGLRRSPTAPDTWDIFVAVRNYGARPREVDVALQFAKSPAGEKHLKLKPNSEEQAVFAYREKAAGFLEVRLNSRDAFPQDDRALIELPAQAGARVVVYSKEPAALKPLFGANPQIEAVFDTPEHYDAAVKADVVVLDRFAPQAKPQGNAIFIVPPAGESPVPVRETRSAVRLEKWNADAELGSGLRTQEVVLESAEIFSPEPGDVAVADGGGGPILVSREKQGRKQVIFGFNPVLPSMRNQIATPLLMANILKWMAPGVFRQTEIEAGTVGTVNVAVDKNTDPSTVHVLDEQQRPLPFTIDSGDLRFFSGAPGTVSVVMGSRQLVYSLTLPDVPESAWKPPAGVKRGVPKAALDGVLQTDLWPWLAVLGGIGLLIDWLMFGRSRVFRLRATKVAAPASPRMRKAS